jgi:DNA invertase Pin-like site-specific DNA recombinase
MGKHVAIYVRVSSKSQDWRSQVRELRRWGTASPYADGTPVEWYTDNATGKSMDRPAWNRLESAIHRGEVSKIVVWRLDRLGRTASGLTKLFEDLCERKIGLFSIKDCIDLETPAGRLMANVLASVAVYENEVRSERILAGQAAARAAGKTWGGSKKGRRLKVTDEQIETIHRLKSEDEPITFIAKATGLSRPTIYSVLGS